jgi:hypothetical protein
MEMTMVMTKPYNPLHLEDEPMAEPEPLHALLYFLNGKRLQIVGAKGEIATLNLSTLDDYFDTFIALLSALREKHGRILIREEHFNQLPIHFYGYFKPYRTKAKEQGETGGEGE